MPDIDDLSNFSEGMHVNPIPASEVRRRGDRMRRRNTALATVGGVVAAAVFIGTPVALMNGSNDDGRDDLPIAPSPSQSDGPTPTWITEIPAEFPLTEGMTDTGEPAEGGTDNFGLCDTSYPTSKGTADIQTWSYSDDGESSVQRTFQLWPDDGAAFQSIDRLEEAVQACPQQPTQGGEEIIETKLVDVDTGGDASLTFAQQVVGDDGLLSQLTTVEVTQVGNAVLVNSIYGSAGGDESISLAAQILIDRSETTRAAMCVFAADPCSTTSITTDPENESETPVENGVAAIPDTFPLAQGLDADGTTGPGADVTGATVADVCGTDVFAPSDFVQRLAALETGPEYRETRELYTFVTADEPIEELTMVRDAVRDCPRIEGETSGYTTKILDGPEGYDSFTFGTFADQGLDGGVYQITRVGSSILVLFAAGETSEASLQPVADNLTATTLQIAPEMCLFTEDGCS